MIGGETQPFGVNLEGEVVATTRPKVELPEDLGDSAALRNRSRELGIGPPSPPRSARVIRSVPEHTFSLMTRCDMKGRFEVRLVRG